MDALSDLLQVIRFSGGVFLEAHFRGPWCVWSQVQLQDLELGMRAAGHLVAFHYVLEGRLEVQVGEDDVRTAGPGDIIVLSRNEPHRVGSDITLSPLDARRLIQKAEQHELARIDYGPAERLDHHFVCGFLSTSMQNHPLLTALPSLLVASVRGRPCADWAETSFRYAAREHAARRPGSQEILSRLSELLFVEAIRGHIEGMPEGATGWLAALRDPPLARALGALHLRPAHPWTADELAKEACLSRSAFAERFTTTVGLPPMSYLIRWRMILAGQRLRESSDTLGQIAQAVGYESESTFSRAFTREMGIAPGAWRKSARGE